MPEHQHGEGSASDEPYEGYAKAKRRLCPSINRERPKRSGPVEHPAPIHGEGSASDEPYEGYAEAERRLCPSINT